MERLGDDAARLLAAAGVPRTDTLAAIVAAWPDAVGDAVARNAWPQRLSRDGTLHVATSSSAWAFELDRLGSDVLDRLRPVVGDVAPQRLRFAPGPLPEPAAHVPEASTPVPRPGPAELRAAAAAAAGTDDAELRGLIARAAAASLARRSVDQPV